MFPTPTPTPTSSPSPSPATNAGTASGSRAASNANAEDQRRRQRPDLPTPAPRTSRGNLSASTSGASTAGPSRRRTSIADQVVPQIYNQVPGPSRPPPAPPAAALGPRLWMEIDFYLVSSHDRAYRHASKALICMPGHPEMSKMRWTVDRTDLDLIHGLSRLVRMMPDKLSLALTVHRSEGHENGAYFIELLLDLLYSQHRRWHDDRKRAEEIEKAVEAAEAAANASAQLREEGMEPKPAKSGANADDDDDNDDDDGATEEEDKDDVTHEAINFPRVNIRPSGFEVRDYLYDLGETIDEMSGALSVLKECLVDNNVPGYEAAVAGFLDACDWIRIYCAVHLELVHPSFVTNSRGAVQFNFENRMDVAEGLIARFVGNSLRDEYYTLMAVYDGHQNE